MRSGGTLVMRLEGEGECRCWVKVIMTFATAK